jgi:PKD repeat protein
MKKGILSVLFMLPFVVFSQTQSPNLPNNTAIEFVENNGQVVDENGAPRPDILFAVQLNGAKAYITRKGIHYVFYGAYETYRLDVVWENASKTGVINRYQQAAATQNFYLPQCPQGIIKVRAYEKVELKEVYPNIDVVLYSRNNWLEYDFVVRPGADLSNIKINYKGANSQQTLANGSLLINTPLGNITEEAPVAYQNGKALQKAAFYTNHDGSLGIATSSDYNKDETLVIDPIIKIWGTYYGGTEADKANTIFTDKLGNVYIGGTTYSNNNIAFNGHQNKRTDSSDVFVAKFDKNGTRLWATYYGGENRDLMGKIFTDVSENVFYLCGTTFSDSAIAYAGYQMEKGGVDDEDDCDAFLVMFDSSGLRTWGTYLGGYDNDILYGGTTDALGNIYVSGATMSPTGIGFSGYQNTFGDAYTNDAFFAKYSKNGILQWSSYFGALFSDDYALIAAGKNGEIYLTGVVENADIAYKGKKSTYAGGKDVYIARFDAASCSRVWVTYYGGTGYDNVKDITVDADGNICITGYTESTAEIAYKAHRNIINGSSDVYIAKFDTDGAPIWGTYFGGEANDVPLKIITDRDKNVIVSGVAHSNTGIKTGSFTNAKAGNTDAFVVKLSGVAGIPQWATYFGGNGDEDGYCAVDTLGLIYLCGTTSSSNVIGYNGHQDTLAGNTDGYLVKFSPQVAYQTPIPKKDYCPGDSVVLNYNVPVGLDSANAFVLQLSDNTGNFGALPPQSGIKNEFSAGAGFLGLALPDTITGSGAYKMRLISSAPIDTIVTPAFSIRKNPTVTVAVFNDEQCLKGNKFMFADSSNQLVLKWLWEFGDGDVSQFGNPTKTYTQAGTFYPKLKLTDIYGCMGIGTDTITVLPTPQVGFDINTTQMCLKTNFFRFTDTTQGNILHWHWNFDDGTSGSSLKNLDKRYQKAGTFVVWHSATNSDGCTDSVAQVIRVFPHPVTSTISGKTLVPKNTTEGYEVTANASNFYSWVVEEGTILSGNGTNSIVVNWNTGNTTGKVKVVEISNFGCAGDTVEIIVFIQTNGIIGNSTPQIVVYPNPTTNSVAILAGQQIITNVLCFDVMGKATQLQATEAGVYNTETLAQGVYMVEVSTQNGQVFTAKLIKQ